MFNIVLFGPPGSGKGTQSAKLIEKFNLIHLSTGDIFRANIKGGTPLGKLANSYMDQGNLVPDEVTIQMLETEVKKYESPTGFIFDGFPRTKKQAAALDDFLSANGTGISLMLSLNVSEEELVLRLIERGKESGRPDDADETVVNNRIAVYKKETAIVGDYYSEQGKLYEVNGVGSVEEVFDRLCGRIHQLQD